MTSWKSLVENCNAKVHVLPEGWKSREDIAEELECSPERVSEHLTYALRMRLVEKKQHKVWDRQTKRVMLIIAYRMLPPPKPKASQALKK